MSTVNRSTVTRRGAFKLGGIAALAAGLPLALRADDTAQAAVVVNGDDLAAACKSLAAEAEAWMEKERQAYFALVATLTPAQERLARTLSDAMTDRVTTELDWRIAEIARHLPGLAPTVRMLAEHVLLTTYDEPGACCTPATSFQP